MDELALQGVTQVIASPGSRCVPLTAAATRHPKLEMITHFDERGAAFCAVGYAKATGKAAALIATSGTAVANWWPAVVEASQDRVPLILLSADRPFELLQTGANQAIDQLKMFGDYCRASFEIPTHDPAIAPEMLRTTIDQAVWTSLWPPAGPVHLNIHLREPARPGNSCPDEWRRAQPYTRYCGPGWQPSEMAIAQCHQAIAGRRHGVVVVGQQRDPQVAREAAAMAQRLGWPLLCDIGSQARLGMEGVIAHGDLLLQASHWKCDTVIWVGGAAVSKRLNQWLTAQRPAVWIQVENHPLRCDPNHRITHRMVCDPAAFCSQIREATANEQLTEWMEANSGVEELLEDLAQQGGESAVGWNLSRQIEPSQALYVSASLPVRHLDLWASSRGPQIPVVLNRGATGIDGIVASAVGYAAGRRGPVTVLLGDLAMLHDLNSLALAAQSPWPITIVVINNGGGVIFGILPWISEVDTATRDAILTPHALRFEEAARMFGIGYSTELKWGSRTTLVELTYEKAHTLKQLEEWKQAVADFLDHSLSCQPV
jgi:2-succinyl-5-enolpyruvyl-6-hydroxy-3-cyclohexene-1-carboxylate synthase